MTVSDPIAELVSALSQCMTFDYRAYPELVEKFLAELSVLFIEATGGQ